MATLPLAPEESGGSTWCSLLCTCWEASRQLAITSGAIGASIWLVFFNISDEEISDLWRSLYEAGLARVVAKCLPDVGYALNKRVVRDGRVVPDGRKQLFFGDHPFPLLQKV
jgi:hypothetical protein